MSKLERLLRNEYKRQKSFEKRRKPSGLSLEDMSVDGIIDGRNEVFRPKKGKYYLVDRSEYPGDKASVEVRTLSKKKLNDLIESEIHDATEHNGELKLDGPNWKTKD